MEIGMITPLYASLLKQGVQLYWEGLLDEDAEVIRCGGNRVIKAKQELQQLEYGINYALFRKARGIDVPDREIEDWISEAQTAAFCLADQIAMYAIPGLETHELYGMKRDIGMLSIRKLTESIQSLNETRPAKVGSCDDLLEVGLGTKKWLDDVIIHPNRQPEDAKLTATLQDSLLYCLAFPLESEIKENLEIPTKKLLRLWTAEGYVQDSPYRSQEQVAQDLLDELIRKKLLVVKKYGLGGEVLKCSVSKLIQKEAKEMCKQKNLCRFMADEPRAIGEKKRPLAGQYRMLAVHKNRDVQEAASAVGRDIRIRSMLHFRTEKMEPNELKLSFHRGYKLLRTLELQGARLSRLPSSIGCLVCLRYLGLRKTQLEDLPPTLEKLVLLMCLDIRDTNIAEVADVSAFTEMRHLYLAKSFRNQKYVFIKKGLQLLVKLQKLAGVACRVPSERQSSRIVPSEEAISNLELLIKLSIKKVSGKSSKCISDAINSRIHLQSLTIACDGDKRFDLSHLQIGSKLRKLKLGGGISHLEVCAKRMKSITYLYLWDSKLSVDPLEALQRLENLLLLSLHKAYTGEEMSCDFENAYPKLQKLSLISNENLTRCTFYQDPPGTSSNPPTQKPMRNLKELVFAKCGKLANAPLGIAQLESLKSIGWVHMPEEFSRSTKDALQDTTVIIQERKAFDKPIPDGDSSTL